MKDIRPMKDLKIEIKDKGKLQEVEKQYHLCADIQSKVGQSLITIRECHSLIQDLNKRIKEASETIVENETGYAHLYNTMSRSQDVLKELLANAILDSFTPAEKRKIKNLISTSPSYGKMELKEILESDVMRGYEANFSLGEITLNKPNPLISRILAKEVESKSKSESKEKPVKKKQTGNKKPTNKK